MNRGRGNYRGKRGVCLGIGLGWGHRNGNGKPETPQRQLLLVYTLCTHPGSDRPAGVELWELELSLPSGLEGLWGTKAAGCAGADSWRRGVALKKQAGAVSAMVTLWEGWCRLPFALQICPAVGDFYSWEQGRSRLRTPGGRGSPG